jgi:stage III sporulation protein SpoIIIAA
VQLILSRAIRCANLTLGQVVTKRFGSAAWTHVKRDVVENAKHATPIWRSKSGQLAMNQSMFATAVPASATARHAPATAVPTAPAPRVVGDGGGGIGANATTTYLLVNSKQTCATALAALRRVDAVGIDCEGSLDLDANFYFRLVQVGVTTTQFGNPLFSAYLFDMKATEADAREPIAELLRWLLQDRSVTKVFHDLRRDVPALCRELHLQRATVQSLLDTQVLFELLVESALEPRRYAGARASLGDVLLACGLPANELKKQFQTAFNEAFWREPVLSADKLRYAAEDVRYLVQLRDIMLRRLSLGVSSWSTRYAAYFDDHDATDIDGADDRDLFGVVCRLTFADPVPYSRIPRAVATLVADLDDNDDDGGGPPRDIGMPPASLLTNAAFEPEFDRLLDVLPATLAARLRERHDLAAMRHTLAELIVDAGFPVDLYHRDGRRERLHDCVVDKDELNELVGEWRDANMVGVDNRVTIEDSLHRISVKIDRLGDVDGLTCRIGKHMPGAAALLRDVVARVAHKGASLLLLGPPGSGKTTLLREVAKELADQYDKRVNVVDTSNEIAGDGERKHPAIGSARRTAVPFDLRSTRHNSNDAQAIVMREVIANHTPEVLVVDELCTKAQAAAAASCGQRGVALVATAHGRELVEAAGRIATQRRTESPARRLRVVSSVRRRAGAPRCREQGGAVAARSARV